MYSQPVLFLRVNSLNNSLKASTPNESPVTVSARSPVVRIPRLFAVAVAVILWSPVIITGFISASLHLRAASLASSRGGTYRSEDASQDYRPDGPGDIRQAQFFQPFRLCPVLQEAHGNYAAKDSPKLLKFLMCIRTYRCVKLEFSCIDYDLSLGSFSLILFRYTKVLIDSELPG